MTFREAVEEMRASHPKSTLSPTVVRGECATRASGIEFTKGKGGMYTGRDAAGEVMLYHNDDEDMICCIDGGRERD